MVKSLLINLDTIFTKSECKLTLRHENNVLIKYKNKGLKAIIQQCCIGN